MTLPVRWWRFILIPLLILASAAVPFVASQKQMLYLLILLCGIAGAAVLLRVPYLGFAFLLISSQLVPYEIGTGTQTGINPTVLLTVLLTGLWLFDEIILHRRLNLIPSKTFVPLLLFVLSAVLSFLIGQFHWFPVSGAPIRAQIGGLAIFVISAFACLVAAHLIKDIAWLERLCWIFMGTGAAYLFGYNYVFYISQSLGRRLQFLFRPGAAGSILWVWLLIIPFSQILLNNHLSKKAKVACGALIAAVLYIRVVTAFDWTSGWLPALAGMVVIFFLYARRPGVLVALFGLVIVGLNVTPLINNIVLGNNQYSFDTRLQAWIVLGELIKNGPIFGFGPANYYWYTPLYNIMGYYVSFNSHNNYVDLLLQTGLVGLITFIWFFVSVWLLAWRIKDRVPEGFQRAYVYCCLGGVAATLVSCMFGDWVVPFVYNIGMVGFRASVYTWLFLGGLVAIEHQLSQQPAASADSTLPASGNHPQGELQ